MRKPDGKRDYYVDEAGDLTLFNRRGVVVVGSEGVSQAFMLGVAHLANPTDVERRVEELRTALLADPYFRGVPSMDVKAGKTALCFHAKDDVPEVRREMFKLIASLDVKVQVAIRRKAQVASEAKVLFARGRKLQDGDVYDDLVKRLFKNLLHQSEHTRVIFARRGKSDRTTSLHMAITKAQSNFGKSWGVDRRESVEIQVSVPSAHAGLQIVDYCLWALQRLYERNEERYFGLVADKFRLIMDLDDKDLKPYGRWYSDKNPLTLSKKKPLTS